MGEKCLPPTPPKKEEKIVLFYLHSTDSAVAVRGIKLFVGHHERDLFACSLYFIRDSKRISRSANIADIAGSFLLDLQNLKLG